MNPEPGPNAWVVGRIDKRPDTSVVVSVHDQRGRRFVDVREWVESTTFVGWTKKGIRLSTDLVPDLIDLLHEAWASEGETPNAESALAEVPPALVVGLRVLGEDIEAIAETASASPEAIMAILSSAEPVCPRCGDEIPAAGADAYVCMRCRVR